jgi:hypothetical protein
VSRLVPLELGDRLVAEVRRLADAADWDNLSQRDKTAMLSRWVHDDQIGGKLKPLVGGEAETRLWLKEVALKRRARAKGPSAENLAAWALSNAVPIKVADVGIKPHHCTAVDNEGRRHYLCWGPAVNLKHLLWAAINAQLDEPELCPVVVIVERLSSPTSRHRRERFEAIARRCGVRMLLLPEGTEARGA